MTKELSVERQFQLRKFAAEIDKMSREDLKTALLLIYEQNLTKDDLYKQLLKTQWGL